MRSGPTEGGARTLDLATATSIVTLNLLSLLRQLVFASEQDRYYLPEFTWPDYLSALCVMAGLSLLVFALIRALRRFPRRVLRPLGGLLLFAALLNPLYFIKNLLEVTILDIVYRYGLLSLAAKAALALTAVALVAAVLRHYWSLLRAVRLALLVMAPLNVLVAVQLCWPVLSAAFEPREDAPGRTAHRGSEGAATEGSSTPRLLVLVFDELDYRLAFPERPDSLELPELDRLVDSAIALSDARLVSWETASAIPSLLVGKQVTQVAVSDRSTLLLSFDGQPAWRSLSATPNLFSQAVARGFTASIVGYYHPYRRLFRGLFEECYSTAAWSPYHLEGPLPGGVAFRRGVHNAVANALPGSHRLGRVATYPRVLDRARSLVGRFDVNLLYVHVQLPHAPFIFDRTTQKLTRFNLSPVGYIDNLSLADRFLGELRDTMEQAGLWDPAAVVVTSDHGWRLSERFDGKGDPRIPLLIKMPGQSSPLSHDGEFSAHHVKDLLLEILAKRLAEPTDVVEWMEERS